MKKKGKNDHIRVLYTKSGRDDHVMDVTKSGRDDHVMDVTKSGRDDHVMDVTKLQRANQWHKGSKMGKWYDGTKNRNRGGMA